MTLLRGLVIAIVVLFIVAAGLLYWQHGKLNDARAEADRYRAASEYHVRVVENLREEMTRRDEMIAARDSELERISADHRKLMMQLEGLKREDSAAAYWIDTAVPDSVLRLLSQGGDGDSGGTGDAAAGVDADRAGASVSGDE